MTKFDNIIAGFDSLFSHTNKIYLSIYKINNLTGLFTYFLNIYLLNDSFNNCICKYKNHL